MLFKLFVHYQYAVKTCSIKATLLCPETVLYFLLDPSPIIVLPCNSVALLNFVQIIIICQRYYMDFSMLLDAFVKWI